MITGLMIVVTVLYAVGAAIALLVGLMMLVVEVDPRSDESRMAYFLLRGGFLIWPLWLARTIQGRMDDIRRGMDP